MPARGSARPAAPPARAARADDPDFPVAAPADPRFPGRGRQRERRPFCRDAGYAGDRQDWKDRQCLPARSGGQADASSAAQQQPPGEGLRMVNGCGQYSANDIVLRIMVDPQIAFRRVQHIAGQADRVCARHGIFLSPKNPLLQAKGLGVGQRREHLPRRSKPTALRLVGRPTNLAAPPACRKGDGRQPATNFISLIASLFDTAPPMRRVA